MKKALKKAIIPSCFFATMGIPFAFVGGIIFFVIGLVVFTLFFFVYGKMASKNGSKTKITRSYLSKSETIEMCQQYLDDTIDRIDKELPKKAGVLMLKKVHHNKLENKLIFSYDYNSSHGIADVASELHDLLKKKLSNGNLNDNKIYIACVYVGTDLVARIKYSHMDGNYYNVTMSCEEMKELLSFWHSFSTEYSWL